MSAYDFNSHQGPHINNNNFSNNHNGLIANNGTQGRCHIQDNEHYQLVGRSFQPTHQMDNMSAQLNTLSKTAMLVRQRRAMLEQLSCYLCKGYLIDATTIDECMDSFCKSCIVKYLRSHNNCPKCGTLIHKTNPLSTIRSDKVLQDIVYKLVPGLYDDEMKRRREFYRGMYAISSDEEDADGSTSSYTGRGSNMIGEQHGIVSHPKPFYKPTDSIDLSIEPQSRGDCPAIYYDNKMQSIVTCFTGKLQQQQQPPLGQTFSAVDCQQFKTYLRCPAKLTALQLKKFIAAKFNICKDDTIHLLYLNESLKDEYSLIDIAYIYDWRGIEHMRLLYIIERDLSKSSKSQEYQIDGRLRESKHRQVGTATQTVKRVCIDPHPRFYEGSNNIGSHVGIDGRNTRSRSDQQAKSIRNHSDQISQQRAPILRSHHSTVVSNIAQSNATNGYPSRNLIATSSNGDRDGHAATRLSPPRSNVPSGQMESLSSRYQDSSKETRASRKLNPETASCLIPKININLHSLQRNQDSCTKDQLTYSKTKIDKDNSPRESCDNSNRQMVPYTMNETRPASVVGPTQSSLVTLASFTESRSNHVVSTNRTTASISTMSRNYNRNEGSEGSSKGEKTSHNSKNDQATPKTPQIALRFVTQRGITFVRRLNSQETELAKPSSSRAEIERNNQRSVDRSITVLPTSSSQSVSNTGQAKYSNAPHISPSSNNKLPASTSGTSSNNSGSSSITEGTTSARHHLKVKPVYKTFVDVTKLKSPNFKKLGYTARH